MVGQVDSTEALRVGDVTARSAAAQSLVAEGEWPEVEALVVCAMTDKSPSVRLVAAASAADIVARHRGASGHAPDQAERLTAAGALGVVEGYGTLAAEIERLRKA